MIDDSIEVIFTLDYGISLSDMSNLVKSIVPFAMSAFYIYW